VRIESGFGFLTEEGWDGFVFIMVADLRDEKTWVSRVFCYSCRSVQN
jgi:hypothetical protein